MSIWTKVTQPDERFRAGVLYFNSSRCSFVTDKHFVFGILSESNHRWCLQSELSDASFPLDRDPATCGTIFQDALGTWFDGEFFRAEQLLFVDAAINNPLVCKACSGVSTRYFPSNFSSSILEAKDSAYARRLE